MTENGRVLSEEEAARLWRRAAELQADAARRLEERARSEERDGQAAGDAEVERLAPDGGYRLEHVRHAALEAGIGDDFLRRALVELDTSLPAQPETTSDRLADVFLGPGQDEMRVSRVYEAPAADVYRVLREVVTSPTYGLRLKDTRGPHPVEGGLLIFDVGPADWSKAESFNFAVRQWADIKEIGVTLSPADAEGRRTEVTIVAPLSNARRVNLWVGGGLVGAMAGAVGVGAGVAASAVAAGFLIPMLVLLVGVAMGVAGASVAGWGGALAYRPLYRMGIGKGREALEGMLAELGVRLRVPAEPGLGSGEPSLPPLPPGPPVPLPTERGE